VCIVDKAGKVIREVKAATEPVAILAVLTEKSLAIERIGLEARTPIEMCLKDGCINAAVTADHIEPHKGDQQKFFFGELQYTAWPWRLASRRRGSESRSRELPRISWRSRGAAYKARGPGGRQLFLRPPRRDRGGASVLLNTVFLDPILLLSQLVRTATSNRGEPTGWLTPLRLPRRCTGRPGPPPSTGRLKEPAFLAILD
jgi:hypothetical protein